jgi:Phage integrase family
MRSGAKAGSYPAAQLLCFLRDLARRELRQPLGRQVLRLGLDRFGRRAVKGDARCQGRRAVLHRRPVGPRYPFFGAISRMITSWLIRLHEKGGKQHMMPCHHALAEALHTYIAAAGIAADKKAFLFRTSRGHGGTALADQPMTQVDAWRMVRKRALAAGIVAPIGNHSFRATGISAYLANGGALEHAQSMAAHESPRTTKLYDRTKERLTQDEVERIML